MNCEEVVEEIIVTIGSWCLERNGTVIRCVLDEEEETTEITEIGHGFVVYTGIASSSVKAERHFYTYVSAGISCVEQALSVKGLSWCSQYIIELLSRVTHPVQ